MKDLSEWKSCCATLVVRLIWHEQANASAEILEIETFQNLYVDRLA